MTFRVALLAAGWLLFSGACLTSARALAAGGSEAPAQRVLHVGSTGDYPPFSYRVPSTDRFIGSDIELAQRLADGLGMRLELVPTTWQTLAQDLEAGRFDLAVGGVSVTQARARVGRFSVPYLQDGKTPIARCGEAARFQSVASIDKPSVRVIVNPGGTNDAFAAAHLAHASLTVAPNLDLFDELLSGRADVMVTDAIETRLQQRLRPGLCAVHPDRPFDRSAKAFYLRTDSALLPAVNRWLTRAIASGEVRRGIDRWLNYPWPLPPSPTVALARLVDARLALMPDVARYKWNRRQAIEDLPREQALLDAVRAQAPQYGLAPERAVAFFAAQIEASKLLQRELFFAWQATGQREFATEKDLAADIRPRLDALNPRLLAALAAVEGRAPRRAFGALTATATSAAAVQAALAPLLQ